MRKLFLIFSLSAAGLNQSSWAAEQSLLTGIEILRTRDDGNQSPYEILHALFDEAQPLAYSTLPDGQKKKDIEAWTCAGGNSDMTLENIPLLPVVPTRIKIHYVAETAKAAIPGRGPLFPGVPAQPEKIASIESIAYFTKGSFSKTPSIECNDCLARKHETQLEPELVKKALMDSNDEGSMVTTTYRGKDGLILFREEVPAYGDQNAKINFYYCWK